MRSAFSCCCVASDQTDAHQLTYPTDPQLDEGFGGNAALGLFAEEGGSGGPNGGRRTSPGSTPTNGISRSVLSLEEKQKEKERLQDMVKEFAKSVVQGQQCQLLPSTAGAPHTAMYSFDKSLRNFSVRPDNAPAITFSMANIHEVVKDVRDTPFSDLLRLPRPHALSADELERRFVCVQHAEAASGS